MALSVQREQFDALEGEWSRLCGLQDEPLPFVHPAWARVWLRHFATPGEERVYAVRDGERLVGVAPLLLRDDVLTLVGHYSICDYMDFVVTPGEEKPFFEALLSHLAHEGLIELDLYGLREWSPACTLLREAADGFGLRFESQREAVAPRIELPPSWDEYLATMPKKDRHELRRKIRRLNERGPVELRALTTPEETSAGMDVFVELMRGSRQDKAVFLTNDMECFFREMVEALSSLGMIRLYQMTMGGRVAASILTFDTGRGIYMYNSGYDTDHSGVAVGLISKALVVGDAISLGRGVLDFLRGDEPYKYDLGAKEGQIWRCRIRAG